MKYQAVRNVGWLGVFVVGIGCSPGSGGGGASGGSGEGGGSQAGQGGEGEQPAGGGNGGSRNGGSAEGGNGGNAGAGGQGGSIATGGNRAGGNAAGGNAAGVGGSANPGGTGGTALPPGKPIFVAQGHGGRILVSCDNGRSWAFESKENNSNGDHEQYSAHGLAYGNNTIVALWGWGTPALIDHSINGKDWTLAIYNGNALSEPMFAGGYFAVGGGHVASSSTNGHNWTPIVTHGDSGQGAGIVRGYGAGTVAGKPVFVGVGANRYVVSADNGRTWQSGSGPPNCADGVSPGSGDIQGAGDGQIFVVTNGGNVCRTADGKAWTSTGTVGSGGISDVVWAGGQLFAYQGTRVSRSANGSGWTATNLTPGTVNLAHVARAVEGPNAGTWAAVNRDGSQFFHSTDGIAWTRAQGGSAGTDMIAIIAAYAQPGGACP